MEAQNLSSSVADTKQSLFLTLLLSAILFWISLGVGDNMSDFQFWIQSTWMTIKLEWIFILFYIALNRRFLVLIDLWKKHQFVVLISVLWLSTVLLSYLLSPYYSLQNPLAYMRLMETITHFLFFIVLWDFFRRYDVDYRMIFIAIILSTLVVLSYFIYIHFAFPDLKADKHTFSMRSDMLILNTHLHRIGYQVETAIILTIPFLFSNRYKYMAILIIGVFFAFLLWLGGRAALLGTVVAFLLLLFLYRKNISTKVLLSAVVLIALSVATILYLELLNLDYLVHAIQKTFQANSWNHLLSGRVDLWSLAVENLEGHWWLGTGPQSYFFYAGRVGEVIHAHNFILQFIGEWGILGCILFLTLLFSAIRYGITLYRHQTNNTNWYSITAGLSILALSITGLFSGIYFFHQTSLYLALAFALWITPSRNIHI